MTATLLALDADRAPTSPRVFRSVVAVTALVTGVAVAWPPKDMVSMTVVVLVIAFLGIPHGAVDHLVGASLASSESSTPGAPHDAAARHWRFHVGYVAAMLAYGLVWLVAPAIALAGFLVLSVHHFGQSDLAYLRIGQRGQRATQVSRGLLLVGLPLVAHLATVGPVIERIGGVDPTSWAWLAGHTAAWSVVLVVQHVTVALIVAPHVRDRPTRVREITTVAALTALFVLADPLLAFAVYFGLWHSLNHLHVLADVLGRRAGSVAMAPTELARLAAPRSAVSVVALISLIIWAHGVGRPELIVPVALIFVSMLTLPHMVVVERLWRAGP